MPTHKLSIIVAMARNRTIGINNTLPWRIQDDLRHFKTLTMGHHMIMGRKTYDSIGKPLPGRTTVVVTRNQELKIADSLQNEASPRAKLSAGCLIAHSLEEAIAACAGDEEIFVVGGAELYAQAMPLTDTLYITEIQQDVDGDALFPEFDKNAWQELTRERCSQTEPQALAYHFVTYQRRT